MPKSKRVSPEACRPAPLRITGASVRKTMSLRKLELPAAVSWLISEWHRSHTPEAAMAIWRKALSHACHVASLSRPAGMTYETAKELLANYLSRIIIRWYCGELPQYPNVESAYFASAVHCEVKLHRWWSSPKFQRRTDLEEWSYDLLDDGRPDATAEDELLDEIPEGPAREAAKLLLHGIPADSLADHIGKRAARKAIDYLGDFLVRRRLPTGAFPRQHRYMKRNRSYIVDGDYDHPLRLIDAAALVGVSTKFIRRVVVLGKSEIRGHSIAQVEELIEYKTEGHTLRHPLATKMPDIKRNPYNQRHKRPVVRIGPDGEETRYESLTAASRDNSASSRDIAGQISLVCNGKRRTAGGFKWRWLKGSKRSNKRNQYDNQSRKRPVVRIDADGVETRYESLKAASRATGVSLGHIWMVCQGTRHTAAGYRWRWLEEPE